jgi:hypothetical protein
MHVKRSARMVLHPGAGPPGDLTAGENALQGRPLMYACSRPPQPTAPSDRSPSTSACCGGFGLSGDKPIVLVRIHEAAAVAGAVPAACSSRGGVLAR